MTHKTRPYRLVETWLMTWLRWTADMSRVTPPFPDDAGIDSSIFKLQLARPRKERTLKTWNKLSPSLQRRLPCTRLGSVQFFLCLMILSAVRVLMVSAWCLSRNRELFYLSCSCWSTKDTGAGGGAYREVRRIFRGPSHILLSGNNDRFKNHDTK